jgi:preprotein translocase subunit Sss1
MGSGQYLQAAYFSGEGLLALGYLGPGPFIIMVLYKLYFAI